MDKATIKQIVVQEIQKTGPYETNDDSPAFPQNTHRERAVCRMRIINRTGVNGIFSDYPLTINGLVELIASRL